jgi:hypothetical protein
MKTETYPLALPSELLQEARQTANETGLSLPDALLRSVKLGLPHLREQSVNARITNVPPLSEQAARDLYLLPDDDTEAIKQFMAAQAPGAEE